MSDVLVKTVGHETVVNLRHVCIKVDWNETVVSVDSEETRTRRFVLPHHQHEPLPDKQVFTEGIVWP